MGLIKAAAGAFGGTMADQWKEFFYCDAIDKDVLFQAVPELLLQMVSV